MRLLGQFVVLVPESILQVQLLQVELLLAQQLLAHHPSKYLGELLPWVLEVFRREVHLVLRKKVLRKKVLRKKVLHYPQLIADYFESRLPIRLG
jgi:hypothetical protein